MTNQQMEWTGWLPTTTPETEPYWKAANAGVLLLQKCAACARTQYYYRAHCSHCWSSEIEDLPSSGRGTVWTFSVVYRNATPEYNEDVPYVVGLVELEGGVKMLSKIVGGDPEAVDFGTPVQVIFARSPSGQNVPLFTVVESSPEEPAASAA
ncbi:MULTISPECIES: Zn-ribbon domain-containing OB-fold protein [unclassified Microbacterium]|uniref:Zn-ribbon domain-containing OB-fold protein n=1 Tax=unclassified Microbacterium TaxID=2609290 RepID=UPI00214B7E35|nr:MULTISPECIES: Zn-ribbon domain-containing OB-fold protein [unclassified Microbacterium]MCR2811325.1 Zn-ribbon domain-containing OB-fold protein [Microbacterium sp. zg.B185]WIM19482.1 Zn-ribbon domain-containing OB-fold protein [Microbacterium sp. zg-B185]